MKMLVDIGADMAAIAQKVNDATATLNDTVAAEAAQVIDEQMKANSSQGRAFGSDRYDNEYQGYNVPLKRGGSSHSGYARRRERKGLNTAPVTMRFTARRIEDTQVKKYAKYAEISFKSSEMGVIFGYHQAGISYPNVGLRTRSIFPVTAESVPANVHELIRRRIAEVIGGKP